MSGAPIFLAISISCGLVSRCAGQPVVLHLDEQVVLAEDLLQAPCLLQRTLLVALQQRLQHVPTQAAGGGDEAVVVLLQQLPVHARLVVVALEEGQAGELDEVAIPLVGLGQQGEVVVELLATVGVATRVVDSAAARGPLVAASRRPCTASVPMIGLMPCLRHSLKNVEHAVHVAVIGDAEGGLAILHRLGHQLVDTGRTVEHRELGVDVQVGERVAHGADLLELA
jgi:hypothetical protein